MAGATRLRHAHWHGVSTLGLEGVSEMAPYELSGASRCVDDAGMILMLWAKRRQDIGESSQKRPVFLVFFDERAQKSRQRIHAPRLYFYLPLS